MFTETYVIVCVGGCIAFLPFSDICGRPVAAADYIALVDRFHSIAVSGVPIFSAATRPEAYRFMTLVDVMYDHTCVALGGCQSRTASPCLTCTHLSHPWCQQVIVFNRYSLAAWCRIRFFCAAAAEPFELFENIVTVDQGKALAKSGASKEKLDALVVDDNLGFTKDRTVSRLFEMQSIECGPSTVAHCTSTNVPDVHCWDDCQCVGPVRSHVVLVITGVPRFGSLLLDRHCTLFPAMTLLDQTHHLPVRQVPAGARREARAGASPGAARPEG